MIVSQLPFQIDKDIVEIETSKEEKISISLKPETLIPWIPELKTTIQPTITFLKEIDNYATELPWDSTQRYLRRIYDQRTIDSLECYQKFLPATRDKLFRHSEKLYKNFKGPIRKIGILKNTKTRIKLRIYPSLYAVEKAIETFKKGNNTPEERTLIINEISRKSDTVLHYLKTL